ncbi:DUF4242 domain-containing protein [Alkalinema sp. FACHB-956]|uniref:DUF4242 domain-containing protein n=1 Tax=Alkalinema sp. FACHB-956 TaxID=2692768 RepID=UPI001685DF31|nr:DUF4242 domain-containing protein [Alkalinema sp. FACHB-956]MBD2329217.1 DUF4242 domain-containing protein [Alkalinema sp. FACHB-956]
MTLYLIESKLDETHSPDALTASLDQLAANALQQSSHLIEAQVSQDLRQLFIILKAPSPEQAQASFRDIGWTVESLQPVRLVGQDLQTVHDRKAQANYLVEWNLPAGLTMEAYLQRKAEKSPLYAQVPAVKFERTYVCEDLSKCLCFYDSPDAETVEAAREVVGAPIDRLTEIRNVH